MRLVVGDDVGWIKIVSPEVGTKVRYGGEQSRENGITHMMRGDTYDELAAATRGGFVKFWDLSNGEKKFSLPIGGSTVGLNILRSAESRTVATCSATGNFELRTITNNWEWKTDAVESHKLGEEAADRPIEVFKYNPDNTSVAYGGKEQPFEILDAESWKSTFKSKNVKNTYLDLRVPVWVTGIAYLERNHSVALTCTGNGEVRIYDTRAQRRPVANFVKLSDTRLMSIAPDPNCQYFLTSDARGKVSKFDIRTGKQTGALKGSTGSIRSVVFHPVHRNIVATGGLDRWVRIFDIEKRKMIHKVYLKQYLNTLMFTDEERIIIGSKHTPDDRPLAEEVGHPEDFRQADFWEDLDEAGQPAETIQPDDGRYKKLKEKIAAAPAAEPFEYKFVPKRKRAAPVASGKKSKSESTKN